MKIKHLIYLRRLSQVLFLLLFLFLLMETRLPANVFLDYSQEIAGPGDIRLKYPVMFFFDMDPLIWLSTTMATHKWLAGAGWALAIVGLTLFLGRFFCGFLCPFGTLHHAIGAIHPSVRGRQAVSQNEKTSGQRLKYGLLAMMSGVRPVWFEPGRISGPDRAAVPVPCGFHSAGRKHRHQGSV